MKVLVIAAPLEGRSGVYRSTYDLVIAARSIGLEWSAVIGMRPSAPARATPENDFVREVDIVKHGFDGVAEIQHILLTSQEFADADVVITMITQSDLAMSRVRKSVSKPWVAYLRGLPWPDKGEASVVKTSVQRYAERRALARADEVWSTTQVLADHAALASIVYIVPAGVPDAERLYGGEASDGREAVWAGRFAMDKQPLLFVQAARRSGVRGRMFGAGPLEEEILAQRHPSVTVEGWTTPDRLWDNAMMFVGTSYREAFGRSAVEAALRGVPIIVGASYGAAPLLVQDRELIDALVIREQSPQAWATAMDRLAKDDDLRIRASNHVYMNAKKLTIEASVISAQQRLQGLV